jgi:hypothetical protein
MRVAPWPHVAECAVGAVVPLRAGICTARVASCAASPPSPACSMAPVRGCSSMAELQLPKLTVRVRFPSPAPTEKSPMGQGKSASRCVRLTLSGPVDLPVRAVHVLLRASLASLAISPHLGVDRARDGLVGLGRRVLVDERSSMLSCPIRAIRSRVLAPAAAASMFPVWRRSVEVQTGRRADLGHAVRPVHERVEVPAPDRGTLRAGEDERVPA